MSALALRALTAIALAAGGLAACGLPARATTPGQVVLRLNDSDFEFRGRLKSFDGEKYVVESSSFGILSLTASKYSCEGDTCAKQQDKTAVAAAGGAAPTMDFAPNATDADSSFSISGPAAISRELMPALIQDYARSIGGGVSQLVGSNPRETEFKLFDARGTQLAQIGLTHTSPGEALESVAKGRATIAVSTRPALAAEAAAITRIAPLTNPTENEHIIALDGTAVIVAPGSQAATLPLKTVTGIFTGKIKNWSELGLPAGAINVYVAAEGAGGSDGLDAYLADAAGSALTPTASKLASEIEVSDAVTRDPNGIGLTSHALLRNAKAVGVTSPCGITSWPNEFAIKAEEYPLGRRVYLYTAGSPTIADAAKLVKFTSSDAAQVTIASSLFMNQSVVSSSALDQSGRIAGWLENGGATPEDRRLAQAFLTEIKDARRLSLTFRFAMGSSRLDAKARDDLARLVALLQTPDMKDKVVMLAGFTDSVGSATANARLANRRAEEVLDVLVSVAPKGSITPRRIRTAGFGAIAPVICNDEAAGSTQNRRVEVWIYDKPPAARPAPAPPPRTVERRKKRRIS